MGAASCGRGEPWARSHADGRAKPLDATEPLEKSPWQTGRGLRTTFSTSDSETEHRENRAAVQAHGWPKSSAPRHGRRAKLSSESSKP